MLFDELERIAERPAPFSTYTAEDLWADPHTSDRMLGFHLDPDVDAASRNLGFIERSTIWLTGLLDGARGSRVLDLGCGPGLYANRLARAGFDVTGVDVSQRSIRHADASADPMPDPLSRPTYVLGNYLEVDIDGSFDLVLLAMCDLCSLSPAQRRRLLLRVRSWLRPEGRFVFDVYGLRAWRERTESASYAVDLMDGFWSPSRYHGFLHTYVYEQERVSLDRYEIVERDRTRTIDNWFQYYDEAALTDELRSCGLVVERVVGDLTGAPVETDPREFAVVATADRVATRRS